MIRYTLFAGAVVSAILVAGCDNQAERQQEKANQAQAEANQKIVEARVEAEQKAARAQATADQKIADAQAKFSKLVEDYRHEANKNLVDLDRKIADLDVKATKATGKAKADLDAKLKRIRADRDAYAADVKAIEVGEATTWDARKARVDARWNDLKALVDNA